jgi:transposase
MHGMSNTCPGRTKTDVLDCQWIQKLHSFGLLNGSFRPDKQIRKLRTCMRLRDTLIVSRTEAVHHMQKALFEMNVQLSNVLSDIAGEQACALSKRLSRESGIQSSLLSTRE